MPASNETIRPFDENKNQTKRKDIMKIKLLAELKNVWSVFKTRYELQRTLRDHRGRKTFPSWKRKGKEKPKNIWRIPKVFPQKEPLFRFLLSLYLYLYHSSSSFVFIFSGCPPPLPRSLSIFFFLSLSSLSIFFFFQFCKKYFARINDWMNWVSTLWKGIIW